MSDIDRVINQPPPAEEAEIAQWQRDVTDELNALDKTAQTQQFFVRDNDPSDPVDATAVLWLTSGGDIKAKITVGSVTKTATIVDFSAL